MNFTEACRTKIEKALPQMPALIARIPPSIFIGVSDGTITMQAQTQKMVSDLRGLFPGVFWTKEFSESTQWWSYTAKVGDVTLSIYACTEAPPTCKAIDEVIEVEEQVPTAFETRKVKKVVRRWDCGDAKGDGAN